MKKICLLFFLVFYSFFIFAEEVETENYLLFLPDSSDKFVNEEKESAHLNNLAQQIKDKNLNEGQVQVLGYSADFKNEIDDFDLSAERAIFVIGELQKRGVSANLFAEPKAYGSVDLWGDNTEEMQRSPNRRVRIIIDGKILIPEIAKPIETEIIETEIDSITEPYIVPEKNSGGTSFGFSWWILFGILGLLFLFLLILLLAKKAKKTPKTNVEALALMTDIDLDEEIRYCAFMLSSHRNFENSDVYWDWILAKNEICAKYEANGYQAKLADDGHWHAYKTM